MGFSIPCATPYHYMGFRTLPYNKHHTIIWVLVCYTKHHTFSARRYSICIDCPYSRTVPGTIAKMVCNINTSTLAVWL